MKTRTRMSFILMICFLMIIALTGCNSQHGRKTGQIRKLICGYEKCVANLEKASAISFGKKEFKMVGELPNMYKTPSIEDIPTEKLPTFHSIEAAREFMFSNIKDECCPVSKFILSYPLTYKGRPIDHKIVDSFVNLIMTSDEIWKYLYYGDWDYDYTVLYNKDFSVSGFAVTIDVYDVTFDDEMESALEAVRKKADEIRSNALTDYDAALAAYDFITENYVYCNAEHTSYNSLYGAALNKGSKCFGFACLYDSILEELGIESRIVIGQNDVEYSSMGPFSDHTGPYPLHAWNLVKMDGLYYYCDTCSDLGTNSSNHEFFMRSVNSPLFDDLLTYPEFWLTMNDFVLSENDLCSAR